MSRRSSRPVSASAKPQRYLVTLDHTTSHQIFVDATDHEIAKAVARRLLATRGLEAFTDMDGVGVDYDAYLADSLGIPPELQTPLFTEADVEGGAA